MYRFEKKKKLRRALYSRPSIALIILVIVFMASATWSWLEKYQESQTNREIAEREYRELKAREEMLTEEVAALKTERGIEEEVRSRFGYVKEGEGVIVVIDDKTNTQNSLTIDKPTGIIGGVWESILSLFK